jgi:hypothetical protein
MLVDAPLVSLSAQGDAEFQGSVGPLPRACLIEADIAFVVRIGAGRWIANSAVRRPQPFTGRSVERASRRSCRSIADAPQIGPVITRIGARDQSG